MPRPPRPASVAEYIAKAAPPARKALRQLRAAIRRAVPGLSERISYDIPTFDLDGKRFLYIAAFREHASMYPVTRGMNARYSRQMAKYRHGAGTLRFALEEPLPLSLVGRLAKARLKEVRTRR